MHNNSVTLQCAEDVGGALERNDQMQPNIVAIRVADASARKVRATLDLASLNASSNDRNQILSAIGEGCNEPQAFLAYC